MLWLHCSCLQSQTSSVAALEARQQRRSVT
jgi:hypothetical protein